MAARGDAKAPMTRDPYGFEVRPEYVDLFRKYAPVWEAEEVERQERWDAFLRDDGDGTGDGGAMDKIEDLLSEWFIGSDSKREAQYQLRSLIQAGIPMSRREAVWKKCLGLPGIIEEGEYKRLLDSELEITSDGGTQGAADTCYVIHSSRQGDQWVEARQGSKDLSVDSPLKERGEGNAEDKPAQPVSDGQPTLDYAPHEQNGAGKTLEGFTPLSSSPYVEMESSNSPPKQPAAPSTLPAEWSAQIEKDLHRTFPGHPVMDSHGRSVLRRILTAYAKRNPAVGYCQGMNFVAGTFMLFMKEEDAFWSLVAVIENLLPGYYSWAMLAPQVDQQVYRCLVEENFPTLATHMDGLAVDVSCVTSNWFLCLYVNALPLESCLRVWDVFFLERDATVLFRVALALVDIFQKALSATADSVDALTLLQATAPMSFDGSRLITTACIGFQDLSWSMLMDLRTQWHELIFSRFKNSMKPASNESLAYEYEVNKFNELVSAFNQNGSSRKIFMRGLSTNVSVQMYRNMKLAASMELEASTPTGGSQSSDAADTELSSPWKSSIPSSSGIAPSAFNSPQSLSGMSHKVDISDIRMSNMQRQSESPFKLLYILPESAYSPQSGSSIRSPAVAAAYEIACTPSPNRYWCANIISYISDGNTAILWKDFNSRALTLVLLSSESSLSIDRRILEDESSDLTIRSHTSFSAALSPASKALARVKQLGFDYCSDSIVRSNSDQTESTPGPINELIWAVESMDKEVAAARKLRESAEAEMESLRRLAEHLSHELLCARRRVADKWKVMKDLERQLERGKTKEAQLDEELKIALKMNGIACQMLEAVSWD